MEAQMRRRNIVVSSMVLASCTYASPEPIVVRPQSNPDAAFSCVVRALNEAGYTVLDSDRPGGLIRAELPLTGTGGAMLMGTRFFRVITASVYDEQGRTAIRVTPARQIEDTNRSGRRGGQTLKEDNDAAAELAAACR